MTVLFMRKDEISEDWEVTDDGLQRINFFFSTWTMINLFILFSKAISFTGFIISSCDFNIVSRASPLSELLLDVGLSFSSSTTSLHSFFDSYDICLQSHIPQLINHPDI